MGPSLRAAERAFVGHPVERVFRTRHGFSMALDVSEWLGRHVYATGEYEGPTTTVFVDRISAGDTVVDVGANAGYFTCLAAVLTGTRGHVVSFEPFPQVSERLRSNVRLNRFSNVDLVNVALSNTTTEATLNLGPSHHLGVSSLAPLDGSTESIPVVVRTGDAMLASMERVDFIKVDVEGAEAAVLEGLAGTLKRWRPDLVVEITPSYLQRFGSSVAVIERQISQLGYKMFQIEVGSLRQLRSLSDVSVEQFNALFTVNP